MDIYPPTKNDCLLNRPIEPGVVEGFRFYYVLRTFVGFILAAIVSLLDKFPLIILFGISMGMLMLLYLHVPWVSLKMGKRFLPVGLSIAVVETMVLEKVLHYRVLPLTPYVEALAQLSLPFTMESISPLFSNVSLEVWRVFPPMFFLLIFISWQYSMKEVGIFTLFVGITELMFPINLGLPASTQLIITFTIVFVRSMAFLVIGFLITQLIAAQRQQRYELSVAQAKLTNYATMVETLSISRERNRLARELHDTLAHTLSAASVQLEAVNSLWDADQDRAQSQLQRALTTTRDGLQETRRALQSLRASPLEDLGLVLALREIGEATELRCGTNVTMIAPERIDGLSPTVEQTMYRVAQEALENVSRHAQAKSAQINVQTVGREIYLEICDDGVGFDTKNIDENTHFGLRGMKERVDALGGEIHITSQPNQGTQVRLTMTRT